MSGENTITRVLSKKFYLSVFTALSIIIIGVISYSYRIGNLMVTTYTPLIDATMEIKLETTTAHLWFEEIISGDRHEDIEEVRKHIAQASWYANAMLEGDKNQEGEFIAINSPYLNQQINEVIIKIEEFKKITEQRYSSKTSAVAGTEIDEKYDAIFRDFLKQIDEVETSLQQIIKKKLTIFKWIQIGLIILVSVTIFILLILFFRFEVNRTKEYLTIVNANTELEKEIAKRIEVEENLLKSEQNLTEAQNLAQIGRWELDLINNKLIWSDTIFKIFEIDANKFGASYETFIEAIHTDDREKVNRAYNESLKTKLPYKIEHRLQMHDGRIKWVIEKCHTEYDNSGNALRSIGIVQDITVQKKTERDLNDSLKREQTNADIVRNSPIAISFGYPDGSLDSCNHAFCNLTGYTEEELLKINWSKVLTPAKWEKIEAKELNKLSPENSYIRYEKEYIHKNGTIIPIELLATAKYDEENNLLHFITFITNIFERKQSESKIKLERDKLTSIFESMLDGVYLVNKNYDIEYVNPVLISEFGQPGNKKCHKYFHNSDEPCTFCKNDEVFAGNKVQWEWTSPRNGQTYDLIDAPLKNSDGSISKLEIFRNITNRKRSEKEIARYSHIFKDSLNEIYLFDANTLKFTQVNNAAKANLGYSMDELRNMTPLDFKPEFTAELFAQLVEPLRKGEKQKILFETVHQRKNSSLYNVEVHLQLLQFEKENVFAAIIIDVSERKEVEEELKTHRNNLEELVSKRTEELEDKNQELDHALKVFVGREYKINELQERIRILEGK
ncbi:MAG: PAS domain S-box protein [Draconibacterium sp.]|nr:PAS domain S-box protein [Draconibacterium sp.]